MELTKEQKNEISLLARDDLVYHFNNVFSKSGSVLQNSKFIGGKYVDKQAEFLQSNKKTCRVSGRDHMKSMSFYAHFQNKVLKHIHRDIEAHYFSYSRNLAAYHTDKIKRSIINNPVFSELKDCKKTAESILKFTWDGEHFITLEPHGLLEFNRGIHSPLIYIDDPFQDPANKLNLTLINKINDIILTQILDMGWDEIHIAGTPQTNQDFFFDEEALHEFSRLILPAITNWENKEVLWPEFRPWDWLMAKYRKGKKRFNQEYQCSPAYSEDSYFSEKEVRDQINVELKNYSFKEWSKEIERREEVKEDTKRDILAGLDIGKKRHPAHLVIFELVDGKWIMIHSKFFDKIKYKYQLAYCKEAIDIFGIDYLWYDNTRGEFEVFEETGQLPGEMIPVVFTRKRKFSLATAWDKAATNENIQLINDDRLVNQILVVDNDLKAVETPEGHGEPFSSISLAFAEIGEEDDEEEDEEEEESDEEIKERRKEEQWEDIEDDINI